MSENKAQVQPAAQAGSTGEAASVGSVVGGVRSSEEHNWLDLWAMNPETRAYLSSARRDAACSHASWKPGTDNCGRFNPYLPLAYSTRAGAQLC